jgi:hypothetical protein
LFFTKWGLFRKTARLTPTSKLRDRGEQALDVLRAG